MSKANRRRWSYVGSESTQVELANGLEESDSRFDFTSLSEIAVSPSEIAVSPSEIEEDD
ncbi:hypothetical protein F2Q70_00014023 [Brassica cretica]|uniref:Uncharacterized protein n=1 Tax=Brassica cretica TaxID=69181 RepID=A0A8S9I645_BRACR|nr:hypothetical protein F2Q70_00014023 [Brassica cretica]KAF2601003.1 hypothetical protein F2Q68_00007056 [Brassica cretica]